MSIAELIAKAFEITEVFQCKGIQVEQMAALRQALRDAYKEATKEPETTQNPEE